MNKPFCLYLCIFCLQLNQLSCIQENSNPKERFLKAKVSNQENQMFCASEKSEKMIVAAWGQESYDIFQKNLAMLSSKLDDDKSDIVLFALGAGDEQFQEQPNFLSKLAKQLSDKKITIYSLDILTQSKSLQISQNTKLHRIQIFIPINTKNIIIAKLKKFIEKKLNEERIVLIGNHTRAPMMQDISLFANIFLCLKPSHKHESNIMLYNQVGDTPWYVCYPPQKSDDYKIYSSNAFFKIDEEPIFGIPSFLTTKSIPYTIFNKEPGINLTVKRSKTSGLKITKLSGEFIDQPITAKTKTLWDKFWDIILCRWK
jgi:hypothetical protein